MVMFFGLTNSSMTFQIIMNKILQDLINTRGGKLHRQCNSKNRERRRTWQSSWRSSEKVGKEWFVCETREVQVED